MSSTFCFFKANALIRIFPSLPDSNASQFNRFPISAFSIFSPSAQRRGSRIRHALTLFSKKKFQRGVRGKFNFFPDGKQKFFGFPLQSKPRRGILRGNRYSNPDSFKISRSFKSKASIRYGTAEKRAPALPDCSRPSSSPDQIQRVSPSEPPGSQEEQIP